MWISSALVLTISSSLASQEVSVSPSVVDRVTASIVEVGELRGHQVEVVLDRGTLDGLVAGWGGTANAGPTVQRSDLTSLTEIGRAEVIRVDSDHAEARITLWNSSGEGVVQVGDTVAVDARAPRRERSLLWRLGRMHIGLWDVEEERLFDDTRILREGETPALAELLLAAMVDDVRRCAHFLESATDPLEDGRFRGRTPSEALLATTPEDLVDFLRYVYSFPGGYLGQDWKFAEIYATWVLQGAIPGHLEIGERALAAAAEGTFDRFLADHRAVVIEHGYVERLYGEAQTLAGEQRPEQARRMLDASVLLGRALELPRELAFARFVDGQVLEAEHLLDPALEAYRDARAAFAALEPPTKDTREGEAFSLHNGAELLRAAGRFGEALPWYREALSIKREAGTEADSVARSQMQLASTLLESGRLEEALTAYEEYAETARANSLGAALADALRGIGRSRAALGQTQQAAETYEALGLSARERDDARGEADALESAADLYWELGDYTKALERYQSCRELRIATQDRRGTAEALLGIGRLRQNLGDIPAARRAIEEALEIWQDLEDLSWRAIAEADLAEIDALEGDLDAALEGYERACRTHAAAGTQARTAKLLLELGALHERRHEYDAARRSYDEAIALEQLGGDDVGLAEALLARADLFRDLHLLTDMASDADRALALVRAAGAKRVEVRALQVVADARNLLGNATEARERSNEAIALAVEQGDRIQEGLARRLLGTIWSGAYRFDEAHEEFSRAAAIFADESTRHPSALAATWLAEGKALGLEGKLEAALARFRQAQELALQSGAAITAATALGAAGFVTADLGDVRGALVLLEEAEQTFRRLENPWGSAEVWQSMAICCARLGQGEQALKYHDQALATYRALPLPWGIAAVLNNRADFFRETGDLARAREDVAEALPIAAKEDPQILASLRYLQGQLAMEDSDLDSALVHFTAGLELSRALRHGTFLADGLQLLADCQRRRGERAWAAGRQPQAEQAFEAAEQALAESDGQCTAMNSELGLASVRTRQGELALSRGDARAAREILTDAIARADRVGSAEWRWKSRFLCSRAEDALGAADSAIRLLREAVAILEEMRRALGGTPRAQELFLKSRIQVYEALANLLLRRSPAAEDESARRAMQEEALQLVGRARFEALAGVRAPLSSLGAADDRRRMQEIERDRAIAVEERENALESGNRSRASSLTTRVAASEAELRTLYARLSRQDADFATRLKFNPRNLGEDMRAAPPGATLVLYYPGQDSLNIWVFTDQGFREWKSRAVSRETLYELVHRFRERMDEVAARAGQRERLGRGFGPQAEILPANPAWYRENCRLTRETLEDLYDHLIGPIEEFVDSASPLLIVPYGQLNYLPFEALRRRGTPEDGESRSLVERCPIVYFVSEDQLARKTLPRMGRPAQRDHDVWVAFADPRGGLGSAREEAERIGRLFEDSEIHSERTKDASEFDVEKLRPDCTILHFATHGWVNRQTTEPFLELAAPPGDGMLAYEDVCARLEEVSAPFRDGRIRLVVLSACKTALSQDDPQAEVLGMPDAFALAGVPAIVASLWSVYTYTTSDLMEIFYQRLGRDLETKADALRAAKVTLLEEHDGRYAHPFFWAPFLLYGDWR